MIYIKRKQSYHMWINFVNLNESREGGGYMMYVEFDKK